MGDLHRSNTRTSHARVHDRDGMVHHGMLSHVIMRIAVIAWQSCDHAAAIAWQSMHGNHRMAIIAWQSFNGSHCVHAIIPTVMHSYKQLCIHASMQAVALLVAASTVAL